MLSVGEEETPLEVVVRIEGRGKRLRGVREGGKGLGVGEVAETTQGEGTGHALERRGEASAAGAETETRSSHCIHIQSTMALVGYEGPFAVASSFLQLSHFCRSHGENRAQGIN